MSPRLVTDDPVWYVAYGSNLSAQRFACYVRGGRPRGGSRTYLGCRDQTPPRRDVAIRLTGGVTFAGSSTVWGGGMAFYDPCTDGEMAARAYLLTSGQLSDVVAQEVRRPIGSYVALGGERPTACERRWPVPSHVYDTLLHVDDRDGMPMFTITSSRKLKPAPPSASYLRTMLEGLAEAFGGTAEERANYLLGAPGVTPTWTASQLVDLCDGGAAR